jgi:ABC-type transport system substrate-binding protein
MPAIGSQFVGTISGYVGEDMTFKWLNGTETRLVLDLAGGDYWYPAPANVTHARKGTIEAVDQNTVKFTIADMGDLGKPAATFHLEGFTGQILPKHVLEPIPWSEWESHPYNTGTGEYESNGQTFTGPIGTGAYAFKEYDPVKQLVTLEKFDEYWEKEELEDQGLFEVEKFYVRYIVEKDAAIAALKNKEVQVLDQNYFLQSDYVAGVLDFATAYPLEGAGIQQLGFNLKHPVYGTGVATPLGMQDPSRAAEAAKYVRQAFDYLIPRNLIVDNLMSGLGTAYGVHVNVVSPYAVPGLVRDYDPAAAKELLAMAGYDVGVTPTGPTALEDYLLGEAVTFTGTFPVEDVVESIDQGGLVVLLEMSMDNETWTPVEQGITTTGGYYSLSYTPLQTGDYFFRVHLTGAGAASAATSAASGPDFPYEGIIQSVTPQTTPSVKVSVISIEQSLSDLIAEVSSLSSEVSSLSSQVSSISTIAYVSMLLALIAIAVGYFMGSRK